MRGKLRFLSFYLLTLFSVDSPTLRADPHDYIYYCEQLKSSDSAIQLDALEKLIEINPIAYDPHSGEVDKNGKPPAFLLNAMHDLFNPENTLEVNRAVLKYYKSLQDRKISLDEKTIKKLEQNIEKLPIPILSDVYDVLEHNIRLTTKKENLDEKLREHRIKIENTVWKHLENHQNFREGILAQKYNTTRIALIQLFGRHLIRNHLPGNNALFTDEFAIILSSDIELQNPALSLEASLYELEKLFPLPDSIRIRPETYRKILTTLHDLAEAAIPTPSVLHPYRTRALELMNSAVLSALSTTNPPTSDGLFTTASFDTNNPKLWIRKQFEILTKILVDTAELQIRKTEVETLVLVLALQLTKPHLHVSYQTEILAGLDSLLASPIPILSDATKISVATYLRKGIDQLSPLPSNQASKILVRLAVRDPSSDVKKAVLDLITVRPTKRTCNYYFGHVSASGGL